MQVRCRIQKIYQKQNEFPCRSTCADWVNNLSRCMIFFPPVKIFGWSKLKAFADGRINVSKRLKLAFRRVENIAVKGENAG